MKAHSGKKGLHFNVNKTNILDVKECLEPTKVKVHDEEIERKGEKFLI